MLFLVNLLEIEFYQKCVGPRPFTLTCRRWTTVSGWPSRPNKTHLFTRHFSAVHTVLQPIKDGAERVRRQMLLAWRHQLDHILVRLFHSGGSRHRNQQTPTGDEQQRRTPHLWEKKTGGMKSEWIWEKKSSLRWRLRRARGFFCRKIELQSLSHGLNRFECTWALHGDWLRAGLWCVSITCLSNMCVQQRSSAAH